MDRIYIVPTTTDAMGRGPKYFLGSGLAWSGMDYGAEDVMLVYCEGIDQATHDTISANADVLTIPENIDNNLGVNAVTAAETFLEGMNIPADWITTSFTYRQVIKIVVGMFRFNQRYAGIDNSNDNIIAKAANNLELQYKDFPVAVKTKINVVADSLNLEKGNIVNTSAVRFILHELGKQFLNRPLFFNGVSI